MCIFFAKMMSELNYFINYCFLVNIIICIYCCSTNCPWLKYNIAGMIDNIIVRHTNTPIEFSCNILPSKLHIIVNCTIL